MKSDERLALTATLSPKERENHLAVSRLPHHLVTEFAAAEHTADAREKTLRRPGFLSAAARERMLSVRGEPLFIADWDSALMIHYEVEGEALQKIVPFELDRWNGRAFLSLVAFTLRRMRPWLGGRLGEFLMKPIATHEFLNVRTYVRHGNETGIFFLAEWLSNRLSVMLGPRIFGLPYRLGRLRYDHDWDRGEFEGWVEDAAGRGKVKYYACLANRQTGRTGGTVEAVACEPGSLEEWLMERYAAFMCLDASKSKRRFFRVWHSPWPQVPVEVEMEDQSLLERSWSFFRDARLAGANFSPGLKNVWMGRPQNVLARLQTDPA